MSKEAENICHVLQEMLKQGYVPCCFVGLKPGHPAKAFRVLATLCTVNQMKSAIAQVMVGDIDPTLLPDHIRPEHGN